MPQQSAQHLPPSDVFSRMRVVEGLAIAGIAGLLSAVLTSAVISIRLDERMASVQAALDEQRRELRDLQRAIYRPAWEDRRAAPREQSLAADTGLRRIDGGSP